MASLIPITFHDSFIGGDCKTYLLYILEWIHYSIQRGKRFLWNVNQVSTLLGSSSCWPNLHFFHNSSKAIQWYIANIRNVLSLCNIFLPNKVCVYCKLLYTVMCRPLLRVWKSNVKWECGLGNCDNQEKMSGFYWLFQAALTTMLSSHCKTQEPQDLSFQFYESLNTLFFASIFLLMWIYLQWAKPMVKWIRQ